MNETQKELDGTQAHLWIRCGHCKTSIPKIAGWQDEIALHLIQAHTVLTDDYETLSIVGRPFGNILFPKPDRVTVNPYRHRVSDRERQERQWYAKHGDPCEL